MLKTMFYTKNVPMWERALRVGVSLATLIYLLIAQPPLLVVIIAVASAVFLTVTGFIGWCPMCAMVGRKIKSEASKH